MGDLNVRYWWRSPHIRGEIGFVLRDR